LPQIRIELPDVSSASDLKSHLGEREHDSSLHSVDGVYRVLVQANGNFPNVLTAIRDWVALKSMGTVPVDVDGTRYTISAA
jgi:hypothetical protein